METLRCRKCKKTWPIRHFYLRKTGTRNPWCNRCNNVRSVETMLIQTHRQRGRYPEKAKARQTVQCAVAKGRIPSVLTLKCMDCGDPAKRYDHYLGYAEEHRLHVQPVCTFCCAKRQKEMKKYDPSSHMQYVK